MFKGLHGVESSKLAGATICKISFAGLLALKKSNDYQNGRITPALFLRCGYANIIALMCVQLFEVTFNFGH